MSGYPVLIEGQSISALVVGGGRVALRKVRSLLATGATVRVVAPTVLDALEQLSEQTPRLTLERRRFVERDAHDATLVFAATDDRETNAHVARVARKKHRLVSVADAPAEGNFGGMATHRAGDVVIGVSAGGVPGAAVRIRDAIAQRFDTRYATAIAALRSLRHRLLKAEGSGAWETAMSTLIDGAFCARVESGTLAAEADQWR